MAEWWDRPGRGRLLIVRSQGALRRCPRRTLGTGLANSPTHRQRCTPPVGRLRD
ncbi:hypothetical protein ppKF707_1187 [Metapseudomonas furukawaii]|uniref:Uncharacterized protein n=1 Tax=Metapseudomonas furukawaii TaxID=1149133 RepID=A0AAD1BXH7_METFU|nr:hypothetical protein ppKF707_1187 [Pseudomonas furukawaii]BAU72965.1 hypothetical protein KF707C_12770 [Pseudomonas furukawaii]